MLFKWALSRHNNKGKQWVASQYFHDNLIPDKSKKEGFRKRKWTFSTKHQGVLTNVLVNHSDVKLKVEKMAMAHHYSPYNPRFADRINKNLFNEFKQKL